MLLCKRIGHPRQRWQVLDRRRLGRFKFHVTPRNEIVCCATTTQWSLSLRAEKRIDSGGKEETRVHEDRRYVQQQPSIFFIIGISPSKYHISKYEMVTIVR